jgi:hypothetical protein
MTSCFVEWLLSIFRGLDLGNDCSRGQRDCDSRYNTEGDIDCELLGECNADLLELFLVKVLNLVDGGHCNSFQEVVTGRYRPCFLRELFALIIIPISNLCELEINNMLVDHFISVVKHPSFILTYQ